MGFSSVREDFSRPKAPLARRRLEAERPVGGEAEERPLAPRRAVRPPDARAAPGEARLEAFEERGEAPRPPRRVAVREAVEEGVEEGGGGSTVQAAEASGRDRGVFDLRGGAAVHADSEQDRSGAPLGEDAADLPTLDEKVVRPLHLGPDARCGLDRLGEGEAGDERNLLDPRGRRRPEEERGVEAARRRGPGPAEPAAPRRLRRGDDDRPLGRALRRARGGRLLRGGDDAVPLDGPGDQVSTSRETSSQTAPCVIAPTDT